MITDNIAIQFDENRLKDAVTCAILMSSIDGEVHVKEWAIIQKFVHTHWKAEYQDFKQYKNEAEQRIAPYLIQSVAIQGVIGELVDNLTKEMTTAQKVFLLHLVEDVMKADGILRAEESRLFETFTEKLSIKR